MLFSIHKMFTKKGGLMKSIILFFFATCSLCADIYEVDSIKEMDKYKEEGVLFLYDIDNTLITLKQTLGTDQWFYYRFGQLKKVLGDDAKALERALSEWTSIQYISEIAEVEKGSSEIIKNQQNEGVCCIGFTTRGLTLSHCTLSQLNSIGIDFSKSAPSKEDLFFQTTQNIIFRHGVLFTSGTNKGKALAGFLSRIEFKPKKIVFINDKHTHLADVEKGCEELGIPFIGLRYNYLDAVVEGFNPKIADIQGKRLFTLLSDEEAQAMIKKDF